MFHPISRRDVLKRAAATAAALSLTPFVRGESILAPEDPVRIAVIGVGARGTELLRQMLQRGDVDVPAVCDTDPKALDRAVKLVEAAGGQRPRAVSGSDDAYRQVLAMGGVDAVLIATPQELHAAMSIDAMRAGKFVGAEVPAACTVEECRQLVATQRETKAGYMMLENYLYVRPVMTVQTMADRGALGELTFGAGSYIHEIRGMRFKTDGSLTWRGENLRDHVGIIYPTHAIGPVCRWMGIGTAGGDRMVSMVAMASRPAATHAYAAEKFGESSSAAKVDFRNGDTNHALIKTAKGRLIELRYDTSSPRPAGMGQYSLQGTRGAYESALGQRMVYLEGRSTREQWEPLDKYAGEFEHPRWKAEGDRAASAGHGGADYFVLADFVKAVRNGKSPIDAVEAATWSVIRPLSAQSIEGGGKPVDVPEFAAQA